MVKFYDIFGFSCFEPSECDKIDILTTLPFEVAILILRLLPSKALFNAALVSTEWYQLCQNDTLLRKRIRRHIRFEKKFYMHNLLRSKKNHLKRKSEQDTVFTVINNDAKRKRFESVQDSLHTDRSTLKIDKPAVNKKYVPAKFNYICNSNVHTNEPFVKRKCNMRM